MPLGRSQLGVLHLGQIRGVSVERRSLGTHSCPHRHLYAAVRNRAASPRPRRPLAKRFLHLGQIRGVSVERRSLDTHSCPQWHLYAVMRNLPGSLPLMVATLPTLPIPYPSGYPTGAVVVKSDLTEPYLVGYHTR